MRLIMKLNMKLIMKLNMKLIMKLNLKLILKVDKFRYFDRSRTFLRTEVYQLVNH